MEHLQDKPAKPQQSTSSPTTLDCPHGWGPVVFVSKVEPAFLSTRVTSVCPIGGVAHCTSCHYPISPNNVERLRRQLDELHLMHKQGVLSDSEYAARREAVIDLTSLRFRRTLFGFRIVACLLVPLGAVITIGGTLLATLSHPGFWGITGGGAIMLAVGSSFALLSNTGRNRRKFEDPVKL